MFHKYLQRQIKKYLGENPDAIDEKMEAFLKSISDTYVNYERDRELSEHAFSVNEEEYQTVNSNLKELTDELEKKVTERTQELSDLAQFPLENPNPIFRVSDEGKIIFKNPAAQKIKQIEQGIQQVDIEDFFEKQLPLLKNSTSFELISDGVEYLFYFKKVEGKGYSNFYGSDVTEKNKLRTIAIENFKKLNGFLESTEDAYYIIHEKNKEKNFVTSKWSHFFGFDPLQSSDLFKERKKCILATSVASYTAAFKKLQLGERISIQYNVKNKTTGQQFWLSESVTKQFDQELNEVLISGKITDITQEYTYALQIKESENRFRSLVDDMPVMIWISDEKNKVIYSNKEFKKSLGFSLESMKDFRDFIKYVHPEDKKNAISAWKKSIENKKEILTEFRIKNQKGSYHNVLEKAVPRFYENGKFAGYIGAYFDFTKEKEYQKSLTIEKEKLELLTRNSPDIILLTDNLGVIEYVSPTTQRILGYTEEELINKKINKFICKDCLRNLLSLSWLNDKEHSYGKFEYKMVKKNGEEIWVESIMSIIKNSESKGYKVLMHNRDVSVVKTAIDALKESEQKYRGIFENMQLGIMEVDNEEKIQWTNKSFEQISGYTSEELFGKSAFQTFLKTDGDEKKMKKIGNKRAKKQESIYEIKMKKRNGEFADVVISGSPIIDLSGQVRGSVGIHWDVTGIRKMERFIEEEKISRQKEIMQATINAEERQKEILGNELHDGVGQILTYTTLFLEMASNTEKIEPALFSKEKKKH